MKNAMKNGLEEFYKLFDQGNTFLNYKKPTRSQVEKLKNAVLQFKGDNNSNDGEEKLKRLENAIDSMIGEQEVEQVVKIWKEVVTNTDIVTNLVKEIGNTKQYPSICWCTGEAYYYGVGVEQNYDKALEYYTKAADKGHDIATFNLGSFYLKGWGVEQNYGKAFEYYKKVSDKGHDVAMTNVGVFYKHGWSVGQNYGKAVEYYQKAAGNGYDVAMTFLGRCYENGEGVKKDISKALSLYQAASLKGEVEGTNSYTNLLNRYQNGIIKTTKNIKEGTPVEQCLSYLKKIKKSVFNKDDPKIAFSQFINTLNKEQIVEMLVNMPKIGLGTSKIDSNLVEALANHPEFYSKLVDTPLKTTIRTKETIRTEPRAIKTSDGKSLKKISVLLAEALERIQNFSLAAETLPQWRHYHENSSEYVTLPPFIQSKILSYLHILGLPRDERGNPVVTTTLSLRTKLYDSLSEQAGHISTEKEETTQRKKDFKEHGKKIYGEKKNKKTLNINTVLQEMKEMAEKNINKQDIEENHNAFLEKRKNWVRSTQVNTDKKELGI